MRKKWLILAALLAPQAAWAQVELTLQAGYRSGGIEGHQDIVCIATINTPCEAFAESDDGSVLGLTVGLPVAESWAVELHVSRQEADLVVVHPAAIYPRGAFGDYRITALEGDLVRRFSFGDWEPFAGAGIGVARLEADPTPIFELDEDRLTANLVGGAHYDFTDHIGLRLEGRARWISLPEQIEESDEVTLEASAGIRFRL